MIRDIQELIYVLKNNNIQPFSTLPKKSDSQSKLMLLYKGIESGRIRTDEDAARMIYPDQKDSNKYRKLKADLREKLFQALIQFNSQDNHFTDYQKAYYECHRQWLFVKILAGQNANTAAIAMASKLIKQAERYEFTLLCMDIAAYLRVQYGLRESNARKSQDAGEMFEVYRDLYNWECLAEQLYTELVVIFVNNRSAKDSIQELTASHFARLEQAMDKFPSYRLQMYGRMIGLMRYTSINDYRSALDYCQSAVDFFRGKPYEARVPLQIFYYQELICNVQLCQFEKGREAAERCLRTMQEGTFNWFKYQELYLTLALHTRQYNKASEVLIHTMQHPRFQFLPENARELWRIYESYLYYLARLNKTTIPGAKAFRVNRFINDTPIFSKDKSGINIMILATKMLFLIAENKYGQLLEEVEGIEQYCYRYLNDKSTMRSYYFIKLLLQIPLGQFDPAVIQKKANRYLEKLKEIPIEVANQSHEIEIIPYEHLWELAMETVVSNASSRLGALAKRTARRN